MDYRSLSLVKQLKGEHTRSLGDRCGNWFAIWVPLVLSVGLGGVAEAHLRGWETIRVTPFVGSVGVLALVASVPWIRSFNATRYLIKDGSISCLAPWPGKSWKVGTEDVEVAELEAVRGGHWVLVLRLREGGRKRIVLTKSMRECL